MDGGGVRAQLCVLALWFSKGNDRYLSNDYPGQDGLEDVREYKKNTNGQQQRPCDSVDPHTNAWIIT